MITVDDIHFIYIKLSETSGVAYSHLYAVEGKDMTLSKVEEDYGAYTIPDTLSLFKGFGIVYDGDKFISGATLRSESNNREYYLKKEFIMTIANDKFVLKCISTTLHSTDN
jgi:hypothetical protein